MRADVKLRFEICFRIARGNAWLSKAKHAVETSKSVRRKGVVILGCNIVTLVCCKFKLQKFEML